MSGGGGDSNTTTSTKIELPSWYEPYAKNLTSQAYSQSQTPYQQYSGERIAPLTSEQTQGLGLVSSLGANNPLTAAANKSAEATLSGQYLNPETNPSWGPGVQSITQNYQDVLMPERNQLFGSANAFGTDNSAYNQYTGQQQQELGKSISGLWGNLYNTERGLQTQTQAQAPLLNASTYQDYQNLIGAGDALRSVNQDQLNLAYQDWLTQQNWPWTQAQNFANLAPSLLGNSGSQSTTGPNPYQTSPLAGAAGGAALGGGAALALGATGYGIPIAVLLGALAGGALSS